MEKLNEDKIKPVSTSESSTPTKKKKTPKWLKALEAQSWQAELLISGLVIAGLLQLPEIVVHWVEGYMLESSSLGHFFLKTASLFFLAGLNALILCFGIHFLLRSIWIALLGLNSVYPEGINIESKVGSGPLYWRKAKEKYPDLSAYNQELDNNCSLMFSNATMIIIFSLSFSIIIIVFYQLFSFLATHFPILSTYTIQIGIGLYLIFMVLAFTIQYLTKKYPEHPKVLQVAETWGTFTGGLFSLYIFQKPMSYITGVLMSNSTSKYGIWYGMIASFFLGISGSMQTSNNPIYRNLDNDRYITFNNKPNQVLAYNYENLTPEGSRIFTPIIPSDIVYEKVLKVFIPTIKREAEQMGIENRSLFQKLKNRYSPAQRDSVSLINLRKHSNFNQFFINNIAYSNPDIQFYTHPHQGEEGILVYLSAKNFLEGKNILEIRKNYFSEDNVQKIVKIPFYYEGT